MQNNNRVEIKLGELNDRQQKVILKNFANLAMKHYSISVKRIRFIHYGENATYKVTDQLDRNYLLRICRPGYHTLNALGEELNWLAFLRSKKMRVPSPVGVRGGRTKFVAQVMIEKLQLSRNAVLFKWTEGKFVKSRVSAKTMYQLGRFIAQLHLLSKNYKCVHRRYWTAEGLAGKSGKFGSLESLQDLTPKQRRKVEALRRIFFSKLKKYEAMKSMQKSIIHADMHFGNFLVLRDHQIAAIDFDDSGWGFWAFDLAIPIMSIRRPEKWTFGFKQKLENSLIEGYHSLRPLSTDELNSIETFIQVRMLSMLGWLNQRRDVPRLRAYYKVHLKKVLKIASDLKVG